MFLDYKTLLEIWLIPGLNLTIVRGTGPRALRWDFMVNLLGISHYIYLGRFEMAYM